MVVIQVEQMELEVEELLLREQQVLEEEQVEQVVQIQFQDHQ
jgi:hypothetical protein